VRPSAVPTNTLLVTAGNSFLEKALALLPGTRVSKTAPADYRPSSDYGLTVFDSTLPPTLPPGNLLLINPPSSPLLVISGTVEGPVVGLAEVNDPLLRYVDWSQVHIARAANVRVPPWARVLVRSTGGAPLLLVGETDGRRVAVLPFDLHASDFPLLIAFPIQLTNLVNWLQPAGTVEAPARLDAGSALALHPAPAAQAVIVTSPTGRQTTLPAAETVAFADTGELGLYTVQQRTPISGTTGFALTPAEYFAVNLFNPVESDLAPQSSLSISGQATPAASPTAQRPLEIWPWLLLAGLALLTLEWWVYNRGRTWLPRLRLKRGAR